MQCLANSPPRRIKHRHDVTSFLLLLKSSLQSSTIAHGNQKIIKVEKETVINYVKNINNTKASSLDFVVGNSHLIEEGAIKVI